MSLVVYFFVALIAAGSVLFGLDFVPAPMSPMPASKYELRAAVPPSSPAPVVSKAEPKPEAKPDVKAAAPVAAAPAVAARPLATGKADTISGMASPNALDQQPASIAAAEPGVAAAAPQAAPRCDVAACAFAYRSFTAADCTYQPSDGPRRLCAKGTPPVADPAAATVAPAASAPEARAQACNVAACAQSYPRSFIAADCTFQPSDGPRRMCTK
jgi:hypothetical protein